MLKENLRNWFSKTHPKGNWVRMSTKGEILGPCAREPGEGKPKCLPLAKARAMDKDDRAAAVRRKRREDPVADRSGKGGAPVNVKTEAANPAQQAAIAIALIKAGKKKGKDPGPQKEEMERTHPLKTFSNLRAEQLILDGLLVEKNKPTNPELWSRAKALARSKFDVYPSAYANGWAAKWYKSKGGGWRISEEMFEQKSAKSGVVETDVFGIKAYHSKCLEPGCKFESKRFSSMKKAQEAAKKHAEKEHFVKEEVELEEDWQKVNKSDRTDGMSPKAVAAYRRENPGSKLSTAVTEKNPTGKRKSRRASFCARMGGMKKRLTKPENARDPDSPINKALRRWNC